jgi:hypothetical protein
MLVIISLYLLTFQTPPGGAESVDALIALLQKAYAERDVDRYLAIHYWEHCPKDFRNRQVSAFAQTSAMGLEIVETVDVDAPTAEKLSKGFVFSDHKKYIPNLQPEKLVIAKHGEWLRVEIPVGRHNGRYYLCMFRAADP